MTLLLKARQACNAAALCDPHLVDDGCGKLDELEQLVGEIVEQGPAKILVFSEWTEMLLLASQRLGALGVEHSLLHGGIAPEKRPALLDRFRDDPQQRVLLSTDAGGVGLNLQAASYVIHLDLPWNPGKLDQRTARAHRLGQTRGVNITYLCAASGIERGIEGTLAGKRAVRSAALDPTSAVEAVDAPSFTAFIHELGEAIARVDGSPVVAAPTPPTLPPAATAASVTPQSRAHERLRFADVVLAAGFPADAVRAAYDALGAQIRFLLDKPTGPEHASLVAAAYRELVPKGRAPEGLLPALARLRDLTLIEAEGVAVDAQLAAGAVQEARTWVERLGRALGSAAPLATTTHREPARA
jgi:hypothetical protein